MLRFVDFPDSSMAMTNRSSPKAMIFTWRSNKLLTWPKNNVSVLVSAKKRANQCSSIRNLYFHDFVQPWFEKFSFLTLFIPVHAVITIIRRKKWKRCGQFQICPEIHIIRYMPLSISVTKWTNSHSCKLHYQICQEILAIKFIKCPPNYRIYPCMSWSPV